ncbi:MAG TPA: hypothetical protein VN672_10970 [Solirubrobacteraceae bacterium]|nr:hypothetical protein [Solirubrobacteraceae bacterium]
MGARLGIPNSVQGLPKTLAALGNARVQHERQAPDVDGVDGAPIIVNPQARL